MESRVCFGIGDELGAREGSVYSAPQELERAWSLRDSVGSAIGESALTRSGEKGICVIERRVWERSILSFGSGGSVDRRFWKSVLR
jgi:hypothetical protein